MGENKVCTIAPKNIQSTKIFIFMKKVLENIVRKSIYYSPAMFSNKSKTNPIN